MFQQFIDILGENGVIHGDEVKKRAANWTGTLTCNALAVLRPQNSDELSQIMKICHSENLKVVPAGGLTGLVHGTDCQNDEIQISFERMNKVISIDTIGKTMLVEAGCPLQKIHEAANEHGLMYAVDLGARGSCTIGGNISTNAGGNQVIRYGMTREQVLGLEAVLADGTIVSSLNSLLKNNAGYDLKQLFIGTEGTLGLVTKAIIRLYPKPVSTNCALVAFDSFNQLTEFFSLISNAFGGALSSFEAMWGNHYELLTTRSNRHIPPIAVGAPYYAIVETQGFDEEKDSENFNQVLENLIENEKLIDATICQNQTQREAIWKIREDIIGLYQLLAPLAIFDVSMPIVEMENYDKNLKTAIKNEFGDAAEVITWGHIGDCNLHIVVSPKIWNDDTHRKIEEYVYAPLKPLNGSISAEHGIGIEKRDFLSISRNENEINLMRTLKSALDPKGILNMGKVI